MRPRGRLCCTRTGAAALAVLLTCAGWAGGAAAPDSAGWRGDGTGRYPKASPPTQWDIDKGTNILWQARVGKSHSSPVVAGDRILLTAEKDLLLCVERRSGKVLWTLDNGFAALPPGTPGSRKRPPAGPGGGYSIPTPVTDGEAVYASYGTGIVVCWGFGGERRWLRYLDLPQANEFGRSASPLLVDGKLLVSIGGLVALDPRTGATLWHAKDAVPAYGTPAAARIGDVAIVVTPNGDCVRVADGTILARGMARTTYTSPVVHDGVAYFAGAPATAVKLPADAREPFQPARLWQADDPEGEFFASPLHHDGILYCLNNEGILYALDAKTGALLYQKELDIPSMSGRPGSEPANLYGSLTLAGSHMLVTNDAGCTLVLAPGRDLKQLARNTLDAGSGASPVPDGGHLFLRGGAKLYCIGAR